MHLVAAAGFNLCREGPIFFNHSIEAKKTLSGSGRKLIYAGVGQQNTPTH